METRGATAGASWPYSSCRRGLCYYNLNHHSKDIIALLTIISCNIFRYQAAECKGEDEICSRITATEP